MNTKPQDLSETHFTLYAVLDLFDDAGHLAPFARLFNLPIKASGQAMTLLIDSRSEACIVMISRVGGVVSLASHGLLVVIVWCKCARLAAKSTRGKCHNCLTLIELSEFFPAERILPAITGVV
jgi:hypothetical protein